VKFGKGQPLSKLLTRRMLVIQLATLSFFFAMILLPVFVLPAVVGTRSIQPLDPSAVQIAARSIRYDAGGELALDVQPDLEALTAKYPKLWFMAISTADDQDVRYGPVPKEGDAMRPALKDIISLQVMLETTEDNPGLLVRTVDKPGGQIKVALGGGPVINVSAILQALTLSLMAATLIVLAVVSAVFVPRLIRRELRGLSAAAESAESIGANARGQRLSETNLPAEVLTLVHAINEALARLDEDQSRRDKFLAATAHELRTPIAVLMARIETAEPFPEREKLLADVGRLGQLANQLLDVQRLTMQQPEFGPVDIVELGEELVGDLAPLAIAKGYELELDAPTDPVRVLGDAPSLNRALTNIVRNAITYGGNRGTIEVRITTDGQICISDEGPGIHPGDEQQIFEPFYRSRPSGEGAGLGLNLVARVISRHGGTIEATNAPQGGALFTIRLPLV